MFPECFFGYPVRKLLKGKIMLAKWFQCVPLDTCFVNRRELRLQCKMIPVCVWEGAHSSAALFNLWWKIEVGSKNMLGRWERNWWRLGSIMMSKWNETIISIRIELQPPWTPTVCAMVFMRCWDFLLLLTMRTVKSFVEGLKLSYIIGSCKTIWLMVRRQVSL